MRLISAIGSKTITEEFDKELKNSLSIHNTGVYEVDENGNLVEAYNLLRDKYFYIIKSRSHVEILTDNEMYRYKYNPKLYCLEKFENENYYYILLAINGMSSKMDFTKKYLRVMDDSCIDYISEVLKLEEKNLAKNRQIAASKLK